MKAAQALREIFAETLAAVTVERGFAGAGDLLEELRERGAALAAAGRPVRTVAVGKGAGPMLRELLHRVPIRHLAGVGSSPYAMPEAAGVTWFRGGHPLPDRDSLAAGAAALELLRGLRPDDLVVHLVSGGGSAAFEAPVDERLTLADLRRTYRALVGCGAGIREVNAVRRRLSAVKGGRLAVAAAPARQITLLLSDVPPGDLSAVASGPSLPAPGGRREALDVVERHDLRRSLPARITAVLEDHRLADPPGAGHPAFATATWRCLLSNRDVLTAARDACRRRGWHCEVETRWDESPVEQAAAGLVERLRGLAARHDGPVAVVAGGEVRSPVRGAGVGGRNQAFVLACVPRIAGARAAVLSAGTDGIDGNSPAAGAVADGGSAERARAAGLSAADARRTSDAHGFFHALGDDLETGPTGTNLRDLRVLVGW